ncbi:MAG: membrane protein insertase YidC [Spirochaetes bacterium]|nr:membrane protein insertase YidC [Spirochaetota bacterium]
MDKKNIIAILLIAVIWGGYFIFFKPDKPAKKPEAVKTESAKAIEGEKTGKTEGAMNIVATGNKGAEKDISVKTKKYAMTLSTKGAAITGCTYLERNIDLIVKKNPFNARGALDFSMSFNDDEFVKGNNLSNALWLVREDGNRITFFTDIQMDGNPVRIEKTYLFQNDGYGFKIEYRLKNNGKNEIAFRNGSAMVSPAEILGPTLDYTNTYNRLMSVYSIGGSFKKADKGGGGFFLGCGSSSGGDALVKETGAINWAGIMSRYFLLIMIPEDGAGKSVIHDNRKDAGFRTGMYIGLNKLEPGKEIKKSFKVYLGEKEKKKLASFDKAIVDAADVNSLIEPIRDFVIWCLISINKLIGNLGWALVIFSILTKVVFMPLTIKSTESMKKMQQLTPKLNELKAKYKDKPDQMQKEMMKLYRENKVNPMGGCLPLLLQMPFFFALYSALIDSIDLWQAPFIFWMKDLSMPDTVLTISGFNLNILPIIMTVSTFFQSKLSTVDTGGQQKMMMMMMPLIFIFIFWSMPSGLVLYWALQNIFQIAHQLIINKRSQMEKAS